MLRNFHSFVLFALCLAVPAAPLVLTGCSKGEAPEGERMGGRPGGPGGPDGGRFAPVAADAKAADIFGQKCQGCHGERGQGGNGPSLNRVAGDSDDSVFKTIHDGRGRMPAFGKQMTEAQLKELVAYVKQLGRPA